MIRCLNMFLQIENTVHERVDVVIVNENPAIVAGFSRG